MTVDQPASVTCTVNGQRHGLEVDAGETLLQMIRQRLWLTGTKEGCLEGECGACTVLIDGVPIASCIQSAAAVDGREIQTIEGLSNDESLSPLQQAFLNHAAVQCGFCIPGMLMTLTALLEHEPSPSCEDVQTALAGNICRCTGYQQMIDATIAAARGEEV